MGNVTNTDTIAAGITELDMEIADVLIAISVITRQLAKKITAKNMPKEETNNAQKRSDRII